MTLSTQTDRPSAAPSPGADPRAPLVRPILPGDPAAALLSRAAIIVPFHNAARTLGDCLAPLTECAELGAELHVVDDLSVDGSVEVTRRFPAARLHLRESRGSSGGARNTAALATRRELLIFVDADVVVPVQAVVTMLRMLAERQCDAVIGCYGEDHDHVGLISQYKNLWIRRTYLKSPRRPRWFWTAFCGVRRDAFLGVGGFNESYEDARGGVDFEFGWRLSEAGGLIRLETGLLCRHLKRFTLRELLFNDMIRARGYVIQALSLRGRSPIRPNRFANVRLSHLLSGVAAVAVLAAWALALAGASGAPVPPGVAERAALGSLLAWLALQSRFLAYFAGVRGPLGAAAVLPVLFLDELFSLMGVALGLAAYLSGERAPFGGGFAPRGAGSD
ncbi:MAG: glycosyltransferase family 2 protein [Candidatus Eisenbacteria bacterium]|nr:glycosyltransferase family 2 protein [Candidatus Eisenbacteria bacterium]